MRKLTEIIVAYAKPLLNNNGYERIDWYMDRFSLNEVQATEFQEIQKQKGLMAYKLFHYDYGYELIWEDEIGNKLVLSGKGI